MNLVKDFTFSSLNEEGQMVMLFPISINLTELLERFGHLSVSIVCSAIEQELRDQGEVVRLVVIIIIIMTFIYTAQIQLYSFQMHLTIIIKDLKIYLKKKKLQH